VTEATWPANGAVPVFSGDLDEYDLVGFTTFTLPGRRPPVLDVEAAYGRRIGRYSGIFHGEGRSHRHRARGQRGLVFGVAGGRRRSERPAGFLAGLAPMTTGTSTSTHKLALALSGGGSRAIAFHLGCLKALHDTRLLHQTSVISSVSGGSVIAALYCSHGGDFADFENKTRAALVRGFVRPAPWAAVSTPEGISAVLAAIPMALDRTAALVVRSLANMMQLPVRSSNNWLVAPRLRRWASRTTILRRAFDELFCSRTAISVAPVTNTRGDPLQEHGSRSEAVRVRLHRTQW
jgi:hypothetical protein